jgi:hypothetical protein
MAGVYDTMFKNAAQQAVKQLGEGLDTTITYSVVTNGSYNVATGKQFSSKTSYTDINGPMAFVKSEEENSRETREAKLYITPDLIGNNQPSFNDELILNYAGGAHTAQIINIDTKRGGQPYLYILLVRF